MLSPEAQTVLSSVVTGFLCVWVQFCINYYYFLGILLQLELTDFFNYNNNENKAIVDYTSPALCTPVTPFRPQVMRPIINMPQEDRTTDMGNKHKKFGKDRTCGSRSVSYTHLTLPTILRV